MKLLVSEYSVECAANSSDLYLDRPVRLEVEQCQRCGNQKTLVYYWLEGGSDSSAGYHHTGGLVD